MKLHASDYAKSWYMILRAAQDQDATMQTLLTHLHHSGQLKLLPEIVRLIKKIELAEQGKTAVTITSAHALDQHTIDAVIAHTLGNVPTEVTVTTDTSLIGGARVRTENTQWDLTVLGQLHAMHNQLLNSH